MAGGTKEYERSKRNTKSAEHTGPNMNPNVFANSNMPAYVPNRSRGTISVTRASINGSTRVVPTEMTKIVTKRLGSDCRNPNGIMKRVEMANPRQTSLVLPILSPNRPSGIWKSRNGTAETPTQSPITTGL